MPCFEVFEALSVRLELTGNFAGMVIPFLGRSKADAESRMVLGVVEIDYLSQNRLRSESVYD